MALTIKDIASKAGCSISTVSAVLSGKAESARISKETAQKVEDICLKLNYKPNMLASSLRKGFTNTIGMVVSDISNSFFIKLANIIEHEVAKQGYQLFIAGSDEDDEKCSKVIDSFVNFRVDGLILAATEGSKNKVAFLNKQKIPLVLLDRYFPGISAHEVVMDNYQSAYDAVSYLIKKGRKRIATFTYTTSMQHMKDRFEGYKSALADHGIRYDKRLTPPIPLFRESNDIIKSHIQTLVEKHNIDSIFFQTNMTALPGLLAISELGYEIPSQLGVFCYHDHDFFNLIKPSITSQHQPLEEMGKACAELILNEIKGEVNTKEKRIFASSYIHERESC